MLYICVYVDNILRWFSWSLQQLLNSWRNCKIELSLAMQIAICFLFHTCSYTYCHRKESYKRMYVAKDSLTCISLITVSICVLKALSLECAARCRKASILSCSCMRIIALALFQTIWTVAVNSALQLTPRQPQRTSQVFVCSHRRQLRHCTDADPDRIDRLDTGFAQHVTTRTARCASAHRQHAERVRGWSPIDAYMPLASTT